MSKRLQILEITREILVEQLGTYRCNDKEALVDDVHLKDHLGADSIDLCMIVVALEDKIGVSFTREDHKSLSSQPTIGNIVDIAYAKLQEKELG